MVSTHLAADVLAVLPDLPRWVDVRGMLLARRAYVVDTDDGCRIVCGRKDRIVAPVSFELSPGLEACALREVPGATILLQDVMLPPARFHLPDWQAEAATLYTLQADRARDWRVPQWPTAPVSADQIEAATHLPPELRSELMDATTRSPVWAASVDRQPMAFAYAAQTTESWFDVSVDTVEASRGRGLGRAAAMGLIVDRLLRGLRPVWGAAAGNEASHRLARSLGFEAVDRLWLMTRPA